MKNKLKYTENLRSSVRGNQDKVITKNCKVSQSHSGQEGKDLVIFTPTGIQPQPINL